MVDLSIGGPAWDGWTFGPWGKARDWRLHAPDGNSFDACEIAELRRALLDVDYLQVQVKILREKLEPGTVTFTASEAATLHAAAAIIARAMPRGQRRIRAEVFEIKKKGAFAPE